jgi:SAM-dependent methyltransferase
MEDKCNGNLTNIMTNCPSCNHAIVIDLGPIPPANFFAGRTLDRIIPGGSLYRCRRCGLGYRYPQMQKDELDELYRQNEPSVWNFQPGDRADWKLAKQRIERQFKDAPDVLDVGCFDGGFLAGLNTMRRFGIEISPVGAEIAKQRGVKILSEDYKRIDNTMDFDVVTAFDVIEHVADPKLFFDSLAKRLKVGGLLVISTGNLDAWSWRIAGSRYWYCAIPEHISFLSRRWFERVAGEMDLKVVEMLPFAHADASAAAKLRESVANALYLFAPAVNRYLRAKGFGNVDASTHAEIRDYPPGWLTARDHLFAVFEKPEAGRGPQSEKENGCPNL